MSRRYLDANRYTYIYSFLSCRGSITNNTFSLDTRYFSLISKCPLCTYKLPSKLQFHSETTPTSFDTVKGLEMNENLHKIVRKFKLNDVYGTSPQDYYLERWEPQPLWNFKSDEAIKVPCGIWELNRQPVDQQGKYCICKAFCNTDVARLHF